MVIPKCSKYLATKSGDEDAKMVLRSDIKYKLTRAVAFSKSPLYQRK